MEDHGSAALRRLLEAHAGAIQDTHAELGDATVTVAASELVPVMRLLRDDSACEFDMLTDLTAVDYLGREPRFEMVYHLKSLSNGQRLRVKTGVSEAEAEIDTLCEVWPSANWMEREVFDMYGIRFRNHPDLRRILLYEEFEGYPLRKDYPKEKRQPLIGPRN